jgi:hypothetical protein
MLHNSRRDSARNSRSPSSGRSPNHNSRSLSSGRSLNRKSRSLSPKLRARRRPPRVRSRRAKVIGKTVRADKFILSRRKTSAFRPRI